MQMKDTEETTARSENGIPNAFGKKAAPGTGGKRIASVGLALLAVGVFFAVRSHPEVSRAFVSMVRYFDGLVRSGLRGIRENPAPGALLAFGGVSFLYGLVHAAGPGHGKALVVAYFLRRRQSWKQAFLLAGIISSVHTVGAIAFSFLFAMLLKGAGAFFKIKMQGYFIVASGVAIAIIGSILLFRKYTGRGDNESHASRVDNPVLLGLLAGIVPCPAAMLIMMFSIAHGIIAPGLISVLGISLGMFLLLGAIGALTIYGRERVLRSLDGSGDGMVITSVLEYLSLALVISIGLLMVSSILL